MRISTLNHGDVPFREKETTAGSQGGPMPGTTMMYAEEPFAEISVQELRAEDYKLKKYTYYAKQEVTLLAASVKPWIGAVMTLENHFRFIRDGQYEQSMKKGQFNFLYTDGRQCSFTLKEGNTYTSLLFEVSPHLIDPFATRSKLFGNFIRDIKPGNHSMMLPDNGYCHVPVLDALDNIMNRPFNSGAGHKFIDALLQAAEKGIIGKPLSGQRIETMYEVRDLVRKDVSTHLKIPQIARTVGINQHDLKEGFRQVFGMGIFEFLIHERMQTAVILLTQEGMSIKHVAKSVGYNNYQSFITAFRKYFGHTPGTVERPVG